VNAIFLLLGKRALVLDLSMEHETDLLL